MLPREMFRIFQSMFDNLPLADITAFQHGLSEYRAGRIIAEMEVNDGEGWKLLSPIGLLLQDGRLSDAETYLVRHSGASGRLAHETIDRWSRNFPHPHPL